jgi:hypothetical protein
MLRCSRLLVPALLGAAGLLAACASPVPYHMDNTVQAFSSLQMLPPNPTYRFERLPSQLAVPEQDRLEAYADHALYVAGLRRDDAAAKYAVVVSAGIQQSASPWPEPAPTFNVGLGVGGHGGGVGVGFGGLFPSSQQQPWYVRQANVLVRDIASGRVVFESHANNSGPWLDPAAALPAMFDAAMQGFPNPPPGVRRVDLNLGAAQPAAVSAPAPAAAPAPVTR